MRLARQLSEQRAEMEQLRQAVSHLGAQLNNRSAGSPNRTTSVEELCRLKAIETTGNDPVFISMLACLRLDSTFPIELGKCLDRKLRELLDTDDRSLNLHDLIMQVKDVELLPEEAIDLAHAIRKQRNIMAHDRPDARTHAARVLYTLFAASLLWPYLPDGQA